MCHRPVIDRDPYALDREITPFASIGTLMGGASIPSVWRPLARRRWLRRLEDRIRRELEKQSHFDARIRAIMEDPNVEALAR
jgi:hypothetical protein